MFNGEFTHSLDDKGRVVFPVKFRTLLGEKFVITKGLHGCLFVFPAQEWNNFEQGLRSQPLLNLDAIRLQRFFSASAYEVSVDGQNRVAIPAALREYAEIDNEVVVVGASNRIEIWSRPKWDAIIGDITPESIAQSAQAIGLSLNGDAVLS